MFSEPRYWRLRVYAKKLDSNSRIIVDGRDRGGGRGEIADENDDAHYLYIVNSHR